MCSVRLSDWAFSIYGDLYLAMCIVLMNFVWGFSAVLMFLAFFGVMLGICTYLVSLACLQIILDMTVTVVKQTAIHLVSLGKQVTSFVSRKLTLLVNKVKRKNVLCTPSLITA